MSKSRICLGLLIALLLGGAFETFGQTVVPATKEQESKLIAVLKSDAPRKEKADACRLLSIIGTKDAVGPLAALLGDEELSHMARYGLEPIADSAVDEAFRDALGKLKGRPLVGVIGSVGVRRDARAVPALANMLGASDADVAQAAARALGSIGTSAAGKALLGAVGKTPAGNQVAFYEGLLRCAERLAVDGRQKEAIAIYDQLLRQTQGPHQVLGGAVRGAILTRGKDGLALLREYLRSDDYILFSAAVQAAQELPGDKAVTDVLTAEMNKLAGDSRILVIKTLGARGDAGALPALFGLAKSGDKSARLEAIAATAMIGDASAVPVLVELMGDGDRAISSAAQEALASLPGKEADDAVMAMLQGSQTDKQLKGLELVERRRMTGAAPALLKAAKGNDESVRTASIRMLGDMAGAVKFPVLVELLLGAKSAGEIRAAERALSAACTREASPSAGKVTIRRAVYGAVGEGGSADVTSKVSEMVEAGALSIEASNGNFGDPAPSVVKQLQVEFTSNGVTQSKTVPEGESIALLAGATPEAFIDELCSALAKAPTQQRLALLRVLRVAQGPKALEAVRAAMKDADPQISSEAVSILCGWPSAEALPDVLKLTTTATESNVKILALRGAIRLIPMQDASVEKKLAGFKDLLPLIQRDEEKRLLLGSLATVPASEALAMAMSYIDNPATKNEAWFAAVAIAEKIAAENRAEVTDAIQKVLKATDNKDIIRRARQTLNKARKSG